jgi:hypothetical protein
MYKPGFPIKDLYWYGNFSFEHQEQVDWLLNEFRGHLKRFWIKKHHMHKALLPIVMEYIGVPSPSDIDPHLHGKYIIDHLRN